jgi:GT2 family glycosyltransferase
MKTGFSGDRPIIARESLTGSSGLPPLASVVIVTYNTPGRILAANLQALARQTVSAFETIIVDNSDRKDIEPLIRAYPVRYLKLRENFGLSLARNVGARHAGGEIVIFLDDDAIPARDFVEQHLQAHQRPGIAGLRGKARPRTRTIYNQLENQYDLGDEIFPFYISLEGNSSFKKNILLARGGFREELKGAGGYEGVELSFRIVQHDGDRNSLIYYPGALIYHDYCGSFAKYVRKLKRHAGHKKMLQTAYPQLSSFLGTYPLANGAETDRRLSPGAAIRLWFIRKGASAVLRLGRLCRRRS